ncbi:contact-dependent growth inhibition system immunity protein [Kitasatospora sp. NPDC101235]|uniref:contact-dependent growth inhibition system immunity protein n=1 Tax=Kitasatospora sp. NPDC101235 TaxID=3364101 RepID=UPI003816E1ED
MPDAVAAAHQAGRGLAYLLPLAVEVLRDDPLAEGDMYEGDLLAAVLTRDAQVWIESPEPRREVRLIASELADVPPAVKRGCSRVGLTRRTRGSSKIASHARSDRFPKASPRQLRKSGSVGSRADNANRRLMWGPSAVPRRPAVRCCVIRSSTS